jgi:hypothetical protein
LGRVSNKIFCLASIHEKQYNVVFKKMVGGVKGFWVGGSWGRDWGPIPRKMQREDKVNFSGERW